MDDDIVDDVENFFDATLNSEQVVEIQDGDQSFLADDGSNDDDDDIQDGECNDDHITNTELDNSQSSDDFKLPDKSNEVLYTVNLEAEKVRFIRVIRKIKYKRNRACYQRILHFAQRENKNLVMDDAKIILRELLCEGKIIDIGKEPNQESFKVVEEINNDDTEDSNIKLATLDDLLQGKTAQDLNNDETEGSMNNTEEVKNGVTDDSGGTIDSLLEFMDEKFYQSIKNMISKEVERTIDLKLSSFVKQGSGDNAHKLKHTHEQDINHLKKVIALQNKDIEFLREQIKSKDVIIKMVLQDVTKNNVTMETKSNNDLSNVNKTSQLNNMAETSSWSNNKKKKGNGELRANGKSKHRSVAILGDSTIKNIEPHKVRKSLKTDQKVYIKSFPGASTKDMESYSIPTKSYGNDLIILHCGTNDLRTSKSPNEISRMILELANDMKTEDNDVMISGILPRNDELNSKGKSVNSNLKTLCKDKYHFIDNSNIAFRHLNSSKLHLNIDGDYMLGSNFVNAINL